jgi:hypothetical protein
MDINYDWDLNDSLSAFEDIYSDIFLRFNYFNNGVSFENSFYEENAAIKLDSKFSSKNILDYYRGFSIIQNGLYKNHLVDPSSLHIWDSTFENDSTILDIRQKIFLNIGAVADSYKICLPINFNDSTYCYIQVGKNLTPSFQDLIYFEDSINSANALSRINITYPKIELNLIDIPWHERHFPIFVNPEICQTPSNLDYAKLIYFYYQRQNPYIQKKYILSKKDDLFCNLSFGNFKEVNVSINKYASLYYGTNFCMSCISFLNRDYLGCYSGINYSGEFIGQFSSQNNFLLSKFNNSKILQPRKFNNRYRIGNQ